MAKLSKLYTRKEIDAIRDGLIVDHGDFCAICDKPRSDFMKRLSVDHNHKTGKIRGLLCFRCNKFLLGKHTIESASKILNYLVEYDLPLEKK